MNQYNEHLLLDGCDTTELAKKYGTPLYVVSETYIEDRCEEIREDFLGRYPNTRAVFASKAFQTLDMCRIIKEQGLGLDVVSGGELYAALKAGTDPEKIVFHGNNKSKQELSMALESQVGTIVADNMSELLLLSQVAEEMGKTASVLLRITPGVDSHTHEFISTGHLDSKFGFSVDSIVKGGELKNILELPAIDCKGFHFHIGSQLSDNKSHLLAVDVLLLLMSRARREVGFVTRELNLGGGFGIKYAGDPPRQSLGYFVEPMMKKVIEFCRKEELDQPLVTIEPGRWIVGEAGITIYEVGTVKTNPVGRTYVAVDGGFPDNPRTALYQAKYDVAAIEKMDAPKEGPVTIAGKCCESGDILVWDANMPALKRGDLIAVMATGAYNYSMANNYNRTPRPAVVMVKDGRDRLSVKRETYEDLLAREL